MMRLRKAIEEVLETMDVKLAIDMLDMGVDGVF